MAPFRKPFSSNLYNQYDGRAKKLLTSLLTSKGHQIIDTRESFSADVISTKNGVIYYSEAEIKTGWRGVWPRGWEEIRIPERKKKLIQKHGRVWFYIFSGDERHCWMIDSRNLNDGLLRETTGAKIFKGEEFYHYPFNQARLVTL